MRCTVVDIETTGLSRYFHKITEIAAVRIEDGEIAEQFHTLVNPQVRIPHFITHLTGIDNDMVKDAPVINEALPQFLDFLKQDIFVAHNATFDHGFLSNASLLHQKVPISNPSLCTRRLASRLMPQLPSKRLGVICQELGVQNDSAHRALGDATATAKCFLKFLPMLKNYGVEAPEQILKFQKMPRAKCVPMVCLN